jgi:hypothetical protein
MNSYFVCFRCLVLNSILLLIGQMILAQSISIRKVQPDSNGFEIITLSDTTTTCRLDLFCSMTNGDSWFGPLTNVMNCPTIIKSGKDDTLYWNLYQKDTIFRNRYDLSFKILLTPLHKFEPEMAWIPAGSFVMGCTNRQIAYCDTDEIPSQRVSLKGFYIGKYEVTQAQWEAVMGDNPSSFQPCDQCPVESVDYSTVQDYISKLNQITGRNYRLPTEAEWEYCARSAYFKEDSLFSGSDAWDAVAWIEANSDDKTHPVGTKQPNRIGLYDLSGNVWEWCSDLFGKYKKGYSSNPKGANSGEFFVNRGGGWADIPEHTRISYRGGNNTSYKDDDVGFRLAISFDW